MRADLTSLIGAEDEEGERRFYRQFVGARFDGLREGGALRTEIVNRLQELVASDEDGQRELLIERLCRIVRDGAGTAQKWTRSSLLAQLRGVVRLKVTPTYRTDLELITQFASDGMADIVDDMEGFRVDRSSVQDDVRKKLQVHRVVNISGLPGCGKSVMLRRVAMAARARGPILFLIRPSDRDGLNGVCNHAWSPPPQDRFNGIADPLSRTQRVTQASISFQLREVLIESPLAEPFKHDLAILSTLKEFPGVALEAIVGRLLARCIPRLDLSYGQCPPFARG